MAYNNQMNQNSPGGYTAGVKQLGNFQVNLNTWEALTQALYDRIAYPANGIASLSYFSQPIGQGTGLGGNPKTLSDTNMVLAGQLPANQMFLVRDIEIDFQTTVPNVTADNPAAFGADEVAHIVNDPYFVMREGNLVFTIGSKSYLTEAPLGIFAPAYFFNISGAVSDQTTPATSLQARNLYSGYRGQQYVLTPNNLLLVANQNFNVALSWPEGLQPITNPASIVVRLNGTLYRKAQ